MSHFNKCGGKSPIIIENIKHIQNWTEQYNENVCTTGPYFMHPVVYPLPSNSFPEDFKGKPRYHVISSPNTSVLHLDKKF